MSRKLIFFLILLFVIALAPTYAAAKKYKLNENVPSPLMNNFRTWILMTKPGTVIDMAGGKLYRIDEGARFVDGMGIMVVIPLEKPDYNYIANKSPALARYWAEKYNFKPLPPDYERDNIT